MRPMDQFVVGWLALSSVLTFVLFAWDKFRAGRAGRRISEWQLVVWSALGGWLGGLAAMLLVRHKTAKVTFWAKFAGALLVWGGLLTLYWQVR